LEDALAAGVAQTNHPAVFDTLKTQTP
jgi:hypothetical protein